MIFDEDRSPNPSQLGKTSTMIHYSCDLCGRSLNPEAERRFEVRLEIRPMQCDAPYVSDVDRLDDIDPLELLEQIIISEEPESFEKPASPSCQKYDLCCDCHKKFAADPLGRKSHPNIHFSAN